MTQWVFLLFLFSNNSLTAYSFQDSLLFFKVLIKLNSQNSLACSSILIKSASYRFLVSDQCNGIKLYMLLEACDHSMVRILLTSSSRYLDLQELVSVLQKCSFVLYSTGLLWQTSSLLIRSFALIHSAHGYLYLKCPFRNTLKCIGWHHKLNLSFSRKMILKHRSNFNL